MTPPPTAEELLAHQGYLTRVARRLVRDDDDALDLVHETWVAALEHPPREARALKSWLVTVLERLAWQRHRRGRARNERERRVARQDLAPGVDETLASLGELECVETAVKNLADPYRKAIWERFYEERTPREIADDIGCSVNTVYTWIHRGLDKLRSDLDRRFESRDAWRRALLPIVAIRRPGGTSADALRPGSALLGLRGAAALVLAFLGVVAVTVLVARDTPGGERALAAETASSALPVPGGVRDAVAVPAVARVPVAAPEPAAAAVGGSRRVRVEVVDAQGAPVSGAEVLHVTPDGVKTVGRSDSRGRLALTVREDELVSPPSMPHMPGCVGLLARRSGLVSSDWIYTVCAPRGRRDVVLALGPPGATLFGRVVDASGQPIEGADARIPVRDRSMLRQGEDCVAVKGDSIARTDADGVFVLEDMLPGRMRFVVTAEGFVPAPSWIEMHQPGRHDRTFVLQRGATLRGVVRDGDRGPVAGALVWRDMRRRQERGTPETLSDENGEFVLEGLAGGRQLFWARSRDRQRRAHVVLEVVAGEEVSWQPTLAPPPEVRVRVVDDATDRPLGGWLVNMSETFEGVPIAAALLTHDDGVAVSHDFPGGEVTVEVHESVLGSEERRFPAALATAVAGGDEVVIRVRRASEPAMLLGRVADADGSRVEHGYLELVRLDWDVRRKFPVDASGAFRIEGLEPASYRMELSRDGRSVTVWEDELTRGARVDLGVVALR